MFERPPACSHCEFSGICMPAGLDAAQLQRLEGMAPLRQRVEKGQALFSPDMPLRALFAVRSGMFKTCVHSECGQEQVFGFQMTGEILGLDGIARGTHCCCAIALEDAEVCVLPMTQLDALVQAVPALAGNIQRTMGRELARGHNTMQMLGGMRAEQRLAAFLLATAERQHLRSTGPHELVLQMTREELGNHLGLKLETVSRTFTKLASLGVIEVDRRRVRINDMAALRSMAGPQP